MAVSTTIRTLIVTDVSLFREGLERLLSDHPQIVVVGSATPDADLPALIAALRPEIVLIDSTTVQASELVPRVTSAAPGIRLVAFAIATDREEEVLACAQAGVSGYVARTATLEELVEVMRSAVLGVIRCPPDVTAMVFRHLARNGPIPPAHQEPAFTRREAEIVALLKDNLSNKQIARRLGIEVATVKNHVHNILEKLQVKRRTDVVTLPRPDGAPRRHESRVAI